VKQGYGEYKVHWLCVKSSRLYNPLVSTYPESQHA